MFLFFALLIIQLLEFLMFKHFIASWIIIFHPEKSPKSSVFRDLETIWKPPGNRPDFRPPNQEGSVLSKTPLFLPSFLSSMGSWNLISSLKFEDGPVVFFTDHTFDPLIPPSEKLSKRSRDLYSKAYELADVIYVSWMKT